MFEAFFNMGKEHSIPAMPFVEKIEDYKSFRIMRLKGVIDMSTIPDYQKIISQAKSHKESIKQNIMLDFKKVARVDSSTIAVLLVSLSELKDKDNKLILVNIPDNLKDMLDIAELNNLFCIYESEDKAFLDLQKNKACREKKRKRKDV